MAMSLRTLGLVCFSSRQHGGADGVQHHRLITCHCVLGLKLFRLVGCPWEVVDVVFVVKAIVITHDFAFISQCSQLARP